MVSVEESKKADPQAKKDVQAELLRLAKIVDKQMKGQNKMGNDNPSNYFELQWSSEKGGFNWQSC